MTEAAAKEITTFRLPDDEDEAAPIPASTLVLNDAQQEAVDAIKAYLDSPSAWAFPSTQRDDGGFHYDASERQVRPFILAGLAGTGKTTLVKSVLEWLVRDKAYPPGRIALLAPTGKASAVLNAKQSIVTARTIHSFLYGRPNDLIDTLTSKCDKLEGDLAALTSNGADAAVIDATKGELEVIRESLKEACKRTNTLTFSKRANEDITEDTDVIIADESSMIGTQLATDLLTIGLPVVFIGDGNQLPPVNDTFGVPLTAPTAKLTEIVRQASDSGVLKLSRHILQHGVLPKTAEGFTDVEFSPHMNPLMFIEPAAREPLGLPQFICYFNNRRHEVNRSIRRKLFSDRLHPHFPHHPFVGEKVVIDSNVPGLRLTRGDIVTVAGYGMHEDDIEDDADARVDDRAPIDKNAHPHAYLEQEMCQHLIVVDRYGIEFGIPAFMNDIMISWAHPSAFDPANREPKALRYMRSLAKDRVPIMFPYAITCHKAQGSEYPHVVLFNDKPKSGNKPYLYTGITRAQQKLTVAGVW